MDSFWIEDHKFPKFASSSTWGRRIELQVCSDPRPGAMDHGIDISQAYVQPYGKYHDYRLPAELID